MEVNSKSSQSARPDRFVRIGGREIEIRPLTLRQLGGVAAVLKQIAPDGLVEANILSLLAEHSAAMAQILQIATGVDADTLLDAPPDEALLLATEVMDINVEFFEARLSTLVRRMFARVGANQTSGAGQTPSPASIDQGSTTTPVH